MEKTDDFKEIYNPILDEKVFQEKIVMEKTNEKIYEEETIEGFGYCASAQSKCMTDCVGGTPALSTLNQDQEGRRSG